MNRLLYKLSMMLRFSWFFSRFFENKEMDRVLAPIPVRRQFFQDKKR